MMKWDQIDHKPDCLWAAELPTGDGYWGCTCGLDRLLLDLEDYEIKPPKKGTVE